MVQSSLNDADELKVASVLSDALDRAPKPLFAVVDGAMFDNLPGIFSEARIRCRSLFLDHSNDDFERSGPWLISLDSIHARKRAEFLAIEKPCAVFWSCADGEMALWRHMRTINEVLIPITGGEQVTSTAQSGFERVLFRHWDPNVLTQVLPTLDNQQFARFFGPATQLNFLPGQIWGGKMTTSDRPEGIEPVSGPLRLDRFAIELIETTRRAAKCESIVSYLKRTLPTLKNPHDDHSLRKGAFEAIASAESFGVNDQAALCRWSYLYFVSAGAINSDKNIAKFMQSKDFTASPNEKVRQIMDAMIYATKEKAKCL